MKCINCESEEFVLKFIGRDLLLNIEGDFHLFECKKCKLVTLEPKLSADELDKFYPKEYISFPLSIRSERNLFRQIDRQFGVNKRVARILRKQKIPGTILDIGCATGIFINEMKNKGWDCYGIEPNAFAANYAKDNLGLKIINKSFEESNFSDSYFDVITMWDVLEHVINPDWVINEVYRILKPNGLFVISMPNSDSIDRRIFGNYWAGWDIPRHNNVFNSKNIYSYLTRFNFHLEEISSFTGRHGVLVLSVNFYLNQKFQSEKVKRIVNLIIKSIFVRALTYPYFMIIDRLNQSSIMTLFARKKIDYKN